MLSSTAATSSTTSRTYRMTVTGTWKLPPGCAPCGRGVRFGNGLTLNVGAG